MITAFYPAMMTDPKIITSAVFNVTTTHVCLMYQNYRSLQKRNSFRLALITNFKFVYDNITLYYMFLKKKNVYFHRNFQDFLGLARDFSLLLFVVRQSAI